MKKYYTLSAAFAAIAILASCEKDPIATTQTRTPNRVEFKQRNISGITVGKDLPADAEAIDLGLSVKWSNMNLGATTPEEFGDLYAWGEIQPSGDYSWFTYEMNNHHADDEKTLYLTRYCFDKYGESQDLDRGGVNLDRNDDAAYIHWGEDWRMPTADEVKELSDKCKWSYDSKSRTFTVEGPNGNAIKIAFQGVGIAKNVHGEPQGAIDGGIWSSTLDSHSSADAVKLMLAGSSNNKFSKGVFQNNRFVGCVIRPVSTK